MPNAFCAGGSPDASEASAPSASTRREEAPRADAPPGAEATPPAREKERMGHFVFFLGRCVHERTRSSETPGVENGRSARARLGFRGFGSEGEVESRPVHRATRRDARYDEAPSSRPVDRPDRARAIDRRRSREGEGSRTQKRGRRRFSRVRRTRGLRVTHPRLCSCPCRSRRRRPCWTRQLPSRPSSPPWSIPRPPSSPIDRRVRRSRFCAKFISGSPPRAAAFRDCRRCLSRVATRGTDASRRCANERASERSLGAAGPRSATWCSL